MRIIEPNHLSLVGLDIETDTSVDGLDPARSPIVAIALSGDGFESVFDGLSAATVMSSSV